MTEVMEADVREPVGGILAAFVIGLHDLREFLADRIDVDHEPGIALDEDAVFVEVLPGISLPHGAEFEGQPDLILPPFFQGIQAAVRKRDPPDAGFGLRRFDPHTALCRADGLIDPKLLPDKVDVFPGERADLAAAGGGEDREHVHRREHGSDSLLDIVGFDPVNIAGAVLPAPLRVVVGMLLLKSREEGVDLLLCPDPVLEMPRRLRNVTRSQGFDSISPIL